MSSMIYPELGQLGHNSDFPVMAHLAALYANEPAPSDIYPALGAIGGNLFIALCSASNQKAHRMLHIGFSKGCLLRSGDGVDSLPSTTPTLNEFYLARSLETVMPPSISLILQDATYLLALLRLLSEAFGANVKFLHASEIRQLFQGSEIAGAQNELRPVLAAIAETYVKEINEKLAYPRLGTSGDRFFLEILGFGEYRSMVALRIIEVQLTDVEALRRYLGDDEDAECHLRTLSPRAPTFLKRRNTCFDGDIDSYINLERIENLVELCACMSEAFGGKIELSQPCLCDLNWKEALAIARSRQVK